MAGIILLVEDEKILGETLAAYLCKDSFNVEVVDDGADVMATFTRCQPVMVLLDLMLPNIDGITLCRQIRKISNVPIIMLTARVDEVDRLLGLEIGADDYICKPFSPREAVARVKAVLRRYHNETEVLSTESASQITISSPLHINNSTMEAHWNDISLSLTAVEFRLLQTMVKEPKRVFSREQLMLKIYSDHRIVSDRTIDSHITKLRRKLSSAGDGKDVIRSVYGAGYKFEFPE
jgi:two-component system, OmpR family, response regulator BaeR